MDDQPAILPSETSPNQRSSSTVAFGNEIRRAGRRLRPVALLLATLAASRCSTAAGYPDRSVHSAAELQSLDKFFLPDVVTTYQDKATDPDEQRAYRDEIINSRLRAIDLRFTEFEKALTKDMAAINVGTDWAVIGLGAAGALVGSTTTKSILAAISGGLTGAKGAIDKNLFYSKTLPALFAQMDAMRKSVLLRIRKAMRDGTADYPLEQALIDVDDYYNAGTIPGAIVGVTATAGAESRTETRRLEHLYRADESTRLLREYWKPAGKTDPARRDALKKWLEEHGIKASITLFLRSEEYVQERQQAVADLIEPE